MGEPGNIHEAAIRYFLAPVLEYLDDASVSEIMINGPQQVYYERGGRLHKTEATFESNDAIEAAARSIAQFVGTRITDERPRLDARLPDGSRVHIIIPPCCRQGVSITLRKFSKRPLTMDRLIELGALDEAVREFLTIAVLLAKNIIVSGGTGSGKTSLLNALSGSIPPEERIVTIEDTAELQLQQEHVVTLEARRPDRAGRGAVSIRDLFISSLRMRPDRIIVGECRGGEALDMIQAMSSGHDGSMSTVHANSARGALSRIEAMSLMAGVDMPLYAIRTMVAAAVHVIVQVARFGDGSRGLVQICELLSEVHDGGYQLRELFTVEFAGYEQGKLQRRLRLCGHRPTFAEEVRQQGLGDRIKLTGALFQP